MATKKVILNGSTIMSVEDTTATEEDVAQGKIFYKSNGDRATGINQGGGSQVRNGLVLVNQNLASSTQTLNWMESEWSGFGIEFNMSYQASTILDHITNCLGIGSKTIGYNFPINLYDNNILQLEGWGNVQFQNAEVYRAHVEIGEPGNYQYLYSSLNVVFLDENDNTLTHEEVLNNYSDKQFRLDNLNVVRYTDDEEVSNFIDSNNVYYKDAQMKESVIQTIKQYLAKTLTLVFKKITEENPKEDKPIHTHNYVCIDSTAPTCTTEGTNTLECSECHEQTTETVPALGHNFDEWVVVAEPTELEDGLRRRTCKICGDTEEEVLPKK